MWVASDVVIAQTNNPRHHILAMTVLFIIRRGLLVVSLCGCRLDKSIRGTLVDFFHSEVNCLLGLSAVLPTDRKLVGVLLWSGLDNNTTGCAVHHRITIILLFSWLLGITRLALLISFKWPQEEPLVSKYYPPHRGGE